MHWRHDILVFANHPWSASEPRPRALMTRLADTHRIFYIEPPQTHGTSRASWEQGSPRPELFTCRALIEPGLANSSSERIVCLRELLGQLLVHWNISSYVAWFYNPMAIRILGGLTPEAIIYECLDEPHPAGTKQPALSQCQAELLDRADLVFADGTKIVQSLRKRHDQIDCLSFSETMAKIRATRKEPVTEEILQREAWDSIARQMDELTGRLLERKQMARSFGASVGVLEVCDHNSTQTKRSHKGLMQRLGRRVKA